MFRSKTFFFRALLVASLPWPAWTACSTDSSKNGADASNGTGGSAGGGTGGAHSDAGPSTGGKETFDAAAAASCHADAGGEQCELCLETLCCDEFKSCLGDATCRKAFETYRSCILTPNQMDQPKCLSTFIRTGNSDAAGHEGLYNCIFIDNPGCGICGGASIL